MFKERGGEMGGEVRELSVSEISEVVIREMEDFFRENPEPVKHVPSAFHNSFLRVALLLGLAVAPEAVVAQNVADASVDSPRSGFLLLDQVKLGNEVSVGKHGDIEKAVVLTKDDVNVAGRSFDVGVKASSSKCVFVPDAPTGTATDNRPVDRDRFTGGEVDVSTTALKGGAFSIDSVNELHFGSGTAWFTGGQANFDAPAGTSFYLKEGRYIDFGHAAGGEHDPKHSATVGLQAKLGGIFGRTPIGGGSLTVEYTVAGRDKGTAVVGITFGSRGEK